MKRKWLVGITGASGARYAVRLLETLGDRCDEVHVVFSEAALRVLREEEGVKLNFSTLTAHAVTGRDFDNFHFYNPRDIGALPASGSATFAGMVVVPCSMGSLGAIAAGLSQNLVQRAADVTIKEGRKLILVPRETPLSAIHLENMLKLARMGVAIVPAMPGFYHQPQQLSDIIDMMTMKILDQMGIESDLVRRWGHPSLQMAGGNGDD